MDTEYPLLKLQTVDAFLSLFLSLERDPTNVTIYKDKRQGKEPRRDSREDKEMRKMIKKEKKKEKLKKEKLKKMIEMKSMRRDSSSEGERGLSKVREKRTP